jgi:hypothetical protein
LALAIQVSGLQIMTSLNIYIYIYIDRFQRAKLINFKSLLVSYTDYCIIEIVFMKFLRKVKCFQMVS